MPTTAVVFLNNASAGEKRPGHQRRHDGGFFNDSLPGIDRCHSVTPHMPDDHAIGFITSSGKEKEPQTVGRKSGSGVKRSDAAS
jgi:hypothetical protein